MKSNPIFYILLLAGFCIVSCDNSNNAAETNQSTKAVVTTDTVRDESGLQVAFIYGDSVNERYKFLVDAENELENERKVIEQRLQGKLQRAEKRAAELQQQAPTMTQAEVQEAQLELQGLEIEMQQFQEKLGNDLRNREIELQKEYIKRVNSFLDEYNAGGNYDMILNFQQGGNLLWIKKAYDITDEVVEGLNAAYQMQLDSVAKAKVKP